MSSWARSPLFSWRFQRRLGRLRQYLRSPSLNRPAIATRIIVIGSATADYVRPHG
ncbi:hypothetical protein PUNSTDRAFT_52576 [Punctularia strigosozonata HHB-11173 SS5]|uniref:uncharacterized protein n=1 Tax=Punctularia strigosozonata (strain HHB-11173) TaxID=741275 RepID=UPI000441727C|nr:uncharacterized protein PUNSTDRAFT_52576 [Punctularia strigosozonata HHB-11173 SS5]EIN09324.1 hypothetical protein PUNSTDRAFT_52576 [Punctularia strigosozonata HHB-11173 SS5]